MTISFAKQLISTAKNFKILTLYTAQKNLIELKLKDAGIPFGNICYTVDTFQGSLHFGLIFCPRC